MIVMRSEVEGTDKKMLIHDERHPRGKTRNNGLYPNMLMRERMMGSIP